MQLDAYMKFEPAPPGKCTDLGVKAGAPPNDALVKDRIEVISFEQTMKNDAGTLGQGPQRNAKPTAVHRMTIIKPLDSTSPKLLQAACSGKRYDKVHMFLCQAKGTSETTSDKWGKVVYFKIVMEDVVITRIHLVGDPTLQHLGNAEEFPILSGAALEMGPLEELDLFYQKIEWTYNGGGQPLNLAAKWNLRLNSEN